MNWVKSFFLPKITRGFVLRLLVVTATAFLIFSQVLIPLRINGHSMEPTYRDGGFTFCWRFRYLLTEPAHGDVVVIRFSGRRVVLLKRVVALAGETVEFRSGVLFVNGQPVDEPYVQSASDWQLAPRVVEPGKVYVVGDNRGVAMERHHFGQVDRQRILGGVVW
nr:signal peptidase I [Desulfobulbus alkaliphilus]